MIPALFFLLFVLFNLEMHAAAHYFLERDSRGLVFLRIDFNSGLRSALELLAAFRCEDDKTVFRINFRSGSSFNFIVNQL